MEKKIQLKGTWPSFAYEILEQNGYEKSKKFGEFGAFKDGQHYKVVEHVMAGDFEDRIYQPHMLTLTPISATQAEDKDFMFKNSSILH